MEPIILATTNLDKITEYQALAKHQSLKLIAPPHILTVAETGTTFSANARLKAASYGRKFNQPVLADDTGLCIRALNNRPGLASNRFASRGFAHARQKLLAALDGLPLSRRQAYFICALAYYDPCTRKITVYTGKAEGLITLAETGSHGFGYDPIFFSLALNQTFAAASLQQKNQVSHRAQAFRKFIAARAASKPKAIKPVLIKS